MPAPTPPRTTGRLLRYAVPISALLFALDLGLWAYAEWGPRFPSWESMNAVAAFQTWSNRPREIHRCEVTLDEKGIATVIADGEPLPPPVAPQTWIDTVAQARRIRRKLVLCAPAATPMSALRDWRIMPQEFLITEFRIVGATGVTRTEFFTKRGGCEHCVAKNAVWVKLESLGGDHLRLSAKDTPPVDTTAPKLATTLIDYAAARRTADPKLPQTCLVIAIDMRPEDTFADWINLLPAMAVNEVKAVY